MFIRSQDKTIIVNTDTIFIGNTSDLTERIVKCLKNDDEILLGTYKTRERALEVLDMIQDAIEDGMSCYEKALIDKYGTTQSWKRNIVFEMPEK